MLTICEDTTGRRECRTVGLCRDCKHWGDTEDIDRRYRRCRAIPSDCDATGHFALDDEFHGPHPDSPEELDRRTGLRRTHKAAVFGATEYDGEFLTRDDFGCVLFEPGG